MLVARGAGLVGAAGPGSARRSAPASPRQTAMGSALVWAAALEEASEAVWAGASGLKTT